MNIERINDEIRITLTIDDMLARTDLDYDLDIEICRDSNLTSMTRIISRLPDDADLFYQSDSDGYGDEIDAETIAFTYGDAALAAVQSLPTIE